MHNVDEHQEYFDDQAQNSNPEFWRRFGRRPAFAGRRVLDLGCGHGALALEMAADGADVLGVDLDEDRIGWAQQHIAPLPVAGSLEFVTADVRTLGLRDEIDLILSKDTFEHVDDLEGVLRCLRDALTPDGQIWAGFSPLYYSPGGDHARTGMKLPWAHTLPRPLVLANAARYQRKPVQSLGDIGLNGMTPTDFRRRVAAAGLRSDSVLYNQGDKRLMPALTLLRRVRALERYTTVSVYTVLARSTERATA
jgi:SAM-dependent methyltransferase